MNTYAKYVPNVWLAKCEEQHEKGDIILIANKYGQEKEHEVHNLIATKERFYYYSITRVDGYNAQTHAEKKAEKLLGYASNAEKKSSDYYEKSEQHREFLSLAEPIKIGHHSEARHRKIIDQSWNNMGKSVEASKKAESYAERATYWEKRKDIVNLSMPESIDYYTYLVEKKTKAHQELLDGTRVREHSFSLTYAKKEKNEAEKNLNLAKKLWE